VGPKTALRFVYYLLKLPRHDLEVMARSIIALADRIKTCDVCYTYCETPTCDVCRDERRDATIICVVEEPRDISTIETTDSYHGRYHVLGGVLNPIDGMTPDVLRVRELIERVRADESIREVILGLSPTLQGESTMMYLSKQLAQFNRRVTRLARGLPIGASLEYADEITLGDALRGRRDA